MSSANTQVDLAGLGGATQDFENAHAEIVRTSTQMTSQIQALRSIWTGDASSIYLSAMEKWCESFNAIAADLESLTGNVNQTKALYSRVHSNTEDAAQAVMQTMAATPTIPRIPALPGF
ncbi:WXG100 family type VII secretion target [Streptacidiphilus sp. ASG 303]|uniref:WXG100 family type VII secretion target n=1 Tax=Streptacidiphilus sp. ASG 303 TaxID=2896847 RepID=UPI001E3DBC55|nr:WXG100 family type VII secretion target [Streptacidiphilus sp. ASG 303]MCD0484105.1 WXG100 family type VII secretion target [Streptacidiphilus sp. ASG 303]